MKTGGYVYRLKIAGRIIEVHALYDWCKNMCKDYLYEGNSNTDILVDIVPHNIKSENDLSQKNNTTENIYLYYDPGYLEHYAIHRKICEDMPQFDTILMHGAVVAYQGNAYMFTAPSGVGKTTRAKLWLEEYDGSYIINGDKPFIHISDGSVIAYGSPWCGKEKWNTNEGMPLRAIFILERANEGENNSITEVSIDDAFSELLKQVYIPKNPQYMMKTMELLQEIGNKVHIYRLKSEPTREGIHLAYETAKP